MFGWIDQRRFRHELLALALLALYGALIVTPGSPLQATFILLHFAAILTWQPFWRGSTRLSPRTAAVTVVVGCAVALWTNWLLLAAWLLVLIGLIGGEHARARRDQAAQWLAITFLFVALLAGLAPPLFFFRPDTSALRALIALSGVLPLPLLVLRATEARGPAPRFDYLRSISVALFALLLLVGSAIWAYRGGIAYPYALLQVLLFVGIAIPVCDWYWRRRAGHSMFRVLWNRYLLNVGSPFERYLMRLSGPATHGLGPDNYLDRALQALGELEWVRGVEAGGAAGERLMADARLVGTRTAHGTEAFDSTAPLTIYTDREPGPALRLHIQLLARLVQQFYLSHRHAADLREREKARAVHETGARLTHDIKNLLQSLQSLSAAVSRSGEADAEDALALVQRQLPPINQRLSATLEKLRDPYEAGDDERLAAREWWDRLRTRYVDGSVAFDGRIDAESTVPRELFDTVAENLLENARYKQSTDRAVRIRAELVSRPEGCALKVTDTGTPVPEDVTHRLFDTAVSSRQGLGIGLRQCARLAERFGYTLRLEANEAGRVCFCLRGRKARSPSGRA